MRTVAVALGAAAAFASLPALAQAPAAPAPVAVPLVATAPAGLDARVADRLTRVIQSGRPDKSSQVSARVVALGATPADDRVLLSFDDRRPMIPASNLKVLTSAAALHKLGGDFRFRTRLAARPVEGDPAAVELAVIGDGDPSFGDSELLATVDEWGTRTVFQTWSRLLKDAGVERVKVVKLDDSVFDEVHIQPNWPENQRHLWYEAQVAGLNLNRNVLDVYLSSTPGGGLVRFRLDPPTGYATVDNSCRRGNENAVWLTRNPGGNGIILGGETNASEQGPLYVTIHDPTKFFGTVLVETLARQGLKVEGSFEVDRTVRAELDDEMASPERPWHVIAVHETPMATILGRTNKDSQNLYAEALAKRLAFAATGRPGSWADAEAAARQYLAAIGSDPDVVALDDGSGMSRKNIVTAKVLVDVMAERFRSRDAEMWLRSMSHAGTDGTLRRRFSSRKDLRGRVLGKTGFINGVVTFSVYLHGRDGNWYAVSVLVNKASNVGGAQKLQEDIVAALDAELPRAAATTTTAEAR